MKCSDCPAEIKRRSSKHRRCDECAHKNKNQLMLRRAARACAKYECEDCKGLFKVPLRGIQKRCTQCTRKLRAKSSQHIRDRAVAAGLCCYCRKVAPNEGFICCKACSDTLHGKLKARRQARRDSGKCPQCGAEKFGTLTYCFTHWAHNTTKGSREVRDALVAKWAAQGGRCAYTGVQLTPGVNASIDHIVPRSKGGEHCAENLQWVCKQINRMKTDMTHEEFVETCAVISEKCRTK